jgi:hypothetical protein
MKTKTVGRHNRRTNCFFDVSGLRYAAIFLQASAQEKHASAHCLQC